MKVLKILLKYDCLNSIPLDMINEYNVDKLPNHFSICIYDGWGIEEIAYINKYDIFKVKNESYCPDVYKMELIRTIHHLNEMLE